MYTVHQAKTNLSKLLEEAERGKEVIIARGNTPVAKLVAYKKTLQPRKPGLLKGKISIPDNFNDEDPEINKLFYGE